MQGFQYHTAYRVGRIGRRHQRGIAMVFFAAGLVVILAMVGLALDLGHAYVNKTRLQNAIDAAALSAAKTLDQNKLSDDFAIATAAAEAAAHNTFTLTLAEDGNRYVDDRIDPDDLDIEFFDELEPLTPAAGVDIPRYVRVRNNSGEDRLLVQATWFIQILPGVGNELTIGGSAMAGPSPSLGVNGGDVCNVFPIMMCSCDPSLDDPDDPQCEGGPETFGYTVGQEIILKHNSGPNWDVGPGNFRLIRIDGPGANILRDNVAGQYDACIDDDADSIETEPGGDTGPFDQGFNVRFGRYEGAMGSDSTFQAQYPPDTNTCYNGNSDPHYTHTDYVNNPSCIGDHDDEISGITRVFERRVIAVPVADCSPEYNGQSTIPLAGFGCLFLTGPVISTGPPADRRLPRAEILADGCSTQGSYGLPDEGEAPATGPGPYKIILYADPESSSG